MKKIEIFFYGPIKIYSGFSVTHLVIRVYPFWTLFANQRGSRLRNIVLWRFPIANIPFE